MQTVKYHPDHSINDIINNATDADDAFCELRHYAEIEKDDPALAYVIGPGLLKKKFSENSVMVAVHSIAQFDQYDEDKLLSDKAKSFIDKFTDWFAAPDFINDLIQYGIAIFKTDNMLHVAHKSTKENADRFPYQVSVFTKGMGVCGDSIHKSPEQILERGVTGAGISYSAEYVPFQDIESLESEFDVTCFSG